MLTINDLTLRYEGVGGARPVLALDRVSLSLASGEFIVIIGPSGCGKTSLLEVIGGFREATSGQLILDGEPVHGPHPDIGVVFQEDSTFPWLTTEQNIEFSLKHRGVPEHERASRVAAMIELIGMRGFEKHRPSQLSGGMRQRVALGRALAPKPKLLLMDEPFGALDEQSRLTLGDELLRIWRATACTIIFITHSLSEAAMLADRVVVLQPRPGRIRDIVENPTSPRDRTSEAIGTRTFTEMTARLWGMLKCDPAVPLTASP
jgi:NitT/TauT family transport system ATP-binding protein